MSRRAATVSVLADRRARRPLPSRPPDADDAGRLIRLVAQVYVEVEAGRRPLSQLAPLLAPAVHARVATLLEAERRRAHRHGYAPPPGPAQVQTSRIHRIRDTIVEATVVVQGAARCTALCVRVERYQGVWRVVELARPEGGMPALRTSRSAPPSGGRLLALR